MVTSYLPIIQDLSKSNFIDNVVSLQGGAIYSSVTKYCTFNAKSVAKADQVYFANNYANLIEQSIYIENTVKCSQSREDFRSKFQFVPPVETQVLFPLYTVDISFEPDVRREMLGEKFNLKHTKMLDIFGHVSFGTGVLRFQSTSPSNSTVAYNMRGPSTISLDDYTGNLEFFVVGPEITQDISAVIDLYFRRKDSYGVGKAEINFHLVKCQLGYEYSHKKTMCVCEAQSPNDFLICDRHGQTLCVKRHYWYSIDFKTTYPCPAQNCWFMYGHCPKTSRLCSNSTEYCSIREENDICWEGKSGFLCSECATNHSFTFAAFKCSSSTTCNPWNTLLLLLALLVYWIVFIVVLLIGLSVNLSVGSGFMFGIVYFFSVATIYTGSSELYSDMWVRILLYIDMAITLCDPELLGYVTNTCFAKSWENLLPHELFRIATPFFLVSAIFFITLFSRYCRMPKRISLAENSPIHAICLLILLSYTSISCTSLKLLIPMKVNDSLRVQVAPTVVYFGNEHIPYAVVGICAELFFCLPICFLFLFAPLISRHVNLVRLRLKPIVDEFQACYKPEYRWFAGFYFLTRQIVYLVHMTCSIPFPQSNYVLTTINVFVLMTHMTVQPYSKKWLNILDTILLTDIIILSLSSPVKMEIVKDVNQFFQYILIPYTLIFFPTIYLFVALGLIFFKKLCNIFYRYKCCIKQPEGRLRMLLRSILIITKDQLNSTSTNLQDPLSGASFREPLLEETENEKPKLNNGVYGSS